MFKRLYQGRKRHGQLENELNIPGSEVSRHLKRLTQKHLITKSTDNYYEITNIGKIFIHVMDIFEVSLEHQSFLNTHDITGIPLNLILQLGNLKTIEISYKTMQNIELFSDLIKNSEKFIYAISEQFQNSLLPIVEKKINDKSINIRALVDKSLLKFYRIPEEWSQMFTDSDIFYEKIDLENICILDKIDFSLVVTDKGSVLFLSQDGEIDYNQCLIGNQESFIKWTTELFEFYWKKGKSLRPFIRKEIKAKR